MTVTKYVAHRGQLAELQDRFAGFRRLRGRDSGGWLPWYSREAGNTTYDKMVFFIGKTGFGKSSTVNAITGLDFMATSDVSACTRECNTLEYRVSEDYFVSIADLPGVGENAERDQQYREMYRDFLQLASAVVYVLRVDSREFAIDMKVLERLKKDIPGIEKRLLLVVGQCDKAEPVSRRWHGQPSMEQFRTIHARVEEVERIFSPHYPVLPYSAATGWYLDVLVDGIVDVLNRV
jgi:predicted GTPase